MKGLVAFHATWMNIALQWQDDYLLAVLSASLKCFIANLK